MNKYCVSDAGERRWLRGKHWDSKLEERCKDKMGEKVGKKSDFPRMEEEHEQGYQSTLRWKRSIGNLNKEMKAEIILSLIQLQPLPQLVSASPISLSCNGGISFSSQTGRQLSEEPLTALRKREDNVQQKVNEKLGVAEMINKSWRSFESCPI